jgi:hypothetical protein
LVIQGAPSFASKRKSRPYFLRYAVSLGHDMSLLLYTSPSGALRRGRARPDLDELPPRAERAGAGGGGAKGEAAEAHEEPDGQSSVG